MIITYSTCVPVSSMQELDFQRKVLKRGVKGVSDKSKTQFKKKSTGQKGRPWPDSVSFKREERSKVAGERRRASTVGQEHVKETQGRACRGAQGVPLGRPGANRRAGGASCFSGRPGCLQGMACAAFCLAGRGWGGGGGGGGCRWSQSGGAAGCRQTSGLGGATGQGVLLVAGKRCGGCHWAGGVAGRRQEVWGVPLGRGYVLLVAGKRCGESTGQGVLLVAGKRCGGCHWAGGAAGRRQEVWGVPLGRGCFWSQARGVGGATGQGVLLVAGKRCGGCHWAGGAAGRRQGVWGVLLVAGKRCGGCHWAGGAAGRRQEVWGVPLGRGCYCMSSRGPTLPSSIHA